MVLNSICILWPWCLWWHHSSEYCLAEEFVQILSLIWSVRVEDYTKKIYHFHVGLNLPVLKYLLNHSLAKGWSSMQGLRLLKSCFSCLDFSVQHPSFEGLFTAGTEGWRLQGDVLWFLQKKCPASLQETSTRVLSTALPSPPNCWLDLRNPSNTQSYHVWNFCKLWIWDGYQALNIIIFTCLYGCWALMWKSANTVSGIRALQQQRQTQHEG